MKRTEPNAVAYVIILASMITLTFAAGHDQKIKCPGNRVFFAKPNATGVGRDGIAGVGSVAGTVDGRIGIVIV